MKMKTKLVAVRVPEELDRQIEAVQGRIKQSKSNVMRLAIERGLESVEQIFTPTPRKKAA